MDDVRGALRDMVRQRRVQAVTATLALVGVVAWVLGHTVGQYLAAASIILFTVATLRWIDDEEVVEKEQLDPYVKK